MLIRNMCLCKKKDGVMNYFLVILVFFLLLISISMIKFEEKKVILAKYRLENAVILSTLSANVADIYEYATFKNLFLDATTEFNGVKEYGYGLNSYSEFQTGTIKAYDIAKKRFKSAIQTNMKVDNNLQSTVDYYSEITLDDFVIYNVRENEVYSYDGTNFYHLGTVGAVKTKTGDSIKCSGIYVRMTVKISALKKEYSLKIEEFVDITT